MKELAEHRAMVAGQIRALLDRWEDTRGRILHEWIEAEKQAVHCQSGGRYRDSLAWRAYGDRMGVIFRQSKPREAAETFLGMRRPVGNVNTTVLLLA